MVGEVGKMTSERPLRAFGLGKSLLKIPVRQNETLWMERCLVLKVLKKYVGRENSVLLPSVIWVNLHKNQSWMCDLVNDNHRPFQGVTR